MPHTVPPYTQHNTWSNCVFLFDFQLSEFRTLPKSTPLASIYVKYFGQEIAFANIDKALVDQAIAV